jgi:methanethiol S-methyltransferase
MLGFLVQWPTLLTLVMFPVLVLRYGRLARREEQEALAQFGAAFAAYAVRTPAFFPNLAAAPSDEPPPAEGPV